jgi:peroxiredoxin
MIALGTKAPEFYLKNMQSGTEFSFADLKGKRER